VTPLALLRELFDAAVAAAAPERCVPPHLPAPPRGRTVVVGAGKAAAAMARAVEEHSGAPLSGVVVTRYGHAVPCARIEVIEAAHPVPDDAGRAAAARVLAAVRGLGADDLVLALWSGGGSSLLASPPPWLPFAEKQRIHRELLRSGAAIGEINCVRKHLSAIKGGRLGSACHPARVLALVISDVPGDDPAVVASGPTLPDPTTGGDALAVLRKYGVEVAPEIARRVRADETPKPGDPRLARAEVRIAARAADALAAAARAASARGLRVVALGEATGEARELGAAHAARARSEAASGARPCVLLSGGETAVTVRGRGRGGRNSEYALALAHGLDGCPGVSALAADTDGIDGTEDNAGCLVRPDTLARAAALGLDAQDHLVRNDAYTFFAALGDLVVTGPTRTNVNDFRAVLVE
jgi:hydroxypyruvate reductase